MKYVHSFYVYFNGVQLFRKKTLKTVGLISIFRLVMLFNTRPKDSPNDFFDRDNELNELEEMLLSRDFIVVEGLYGVGKTSLVRVSLNELKDKIFPITIDLSHLPPNKKKAIIEFRKQLISNSQSIVNSVSTRRRATITSTEPDITLDGDLESVETYLKLFRNLDKYAEENNKILVLFIDEFQNINRLKINIPALFKRIHDWNSNTVVVLGGGDKYEMEKVLRKIESKTVFSGRSFERLILGPFTVDSAKDFLREGFNEVGVDVEEKEIDEAVKRVGTIPRNLVLFGKLYSYSKKYNTPFDFDHFFSKIALSNAIVIYRVLKSLSFGEEVARVVLALEELGKGSLENIKEYEENVYKINADEREIKRALEFLVYDSYAYENPQDHTYSLINDAVIKKAIYIACERYLKSNSSSLNEEEPIKKQK